MTHPHVNELMLRIDDLDQRVVDLLAERFACSRLIGKLKRDLAMPASDSVRIGAQRLRFVRLCVGAGLDSIQADALIDAIQRTVLSERSRQFAQIGGDAP